MFSTKLDIFISIVMFLIFFVVYFVALITLSVHIYITAVFIVPLICSLNTKNILRVFSDV